MFREQIEKFKKLDWFSKLFICAMVCLATLYGGSKSIYNYGSDASIDVTEADLEYDEDADESVLTLVATGTLSEDTKIWVREAVSENWVQLIPIAYPDVGVYVFEGEQKHTFWYFGEDLPPVIVENDAGIEITSFIVTGKRVHIEWSISDDRLTGAEFQVHYRERVSKHSSTMTEWQDLGDPVNGYVFNYDGFTVDKYREYRITAEISSETSGEPTPDPEGGQQ